MKISEDLAWEKIVKNKMPPESQRLLNKPMVCQAFSFFIAAGCVPCFLIMLWVHPISCVPYTILGAVFLLSCISTGVSGISLNKKKLALSIECLQKDPNAQDKNSLIMKTDGVGRKEGIELITNYYREEILLEYCRNNDLPIDIPTLKAIKDEIGTMNKGHELFSKYPISLSFGVPLIFFVASSIVTLLLDIYNVSMAIYVILVSLCLFCILYTIDIWRGMHVTSKTHKYRNLYKTIVHIIYK